MFWLGMLLSATGGLWLVVNAFRSSGALWGLGSLFVPFVAQLYGLLNFGDNKLPLAISLAGLGLVGLGWSDYMAQAAAMQAAAGALPQ